MAQVQAAYDFSAQPGSGELSITAGEVLTVIRDNVDGGWIEGKNAKGKVGLFPETYVTRLTATSLPPAAAPPPLPFGSAAHNAPLPNPPSSTEFNNKPFAPQQSHMYSQPPLPAVIGGGASNYDPWNDPLPPAPTGNSSTSLPSHPPPSAQQQQPVYPPLDTASNNLDDDFDDEWTGDDDDFGDDIQRTAVARSRSAGPDTNSLSKGGSAGGGSRLKNINRFSNFVKTGMESFVLATSKLSIQPQEQYEIIISTGDQVRWAPPAQFYSCIVDKPKKESKLKGLKSFIAYSLTSSMNGIQVSRRYKHFDWLHEQLGNKFLLIPSPPLPEKQVAGRYEEDLIEHRKCILQLWVNKICRHPVLSQSEVWRHFMTCTDEKKWKAGKRQAEKDEFVGGNFFHCVRVPQQHLDPRRIEQQVETFSRCVRSLDDSVKVIYERINESQKRLTGPYKSNWQKTAAAFSSLGASFEIDQSSGTGVTSAIKESAHVLNNIAMQHEDHGKKALEQLLNWLYTYKGLLASVPEVLNVHKSAQAKLRDNERLHSEGKLSAQEADAISHRVDTISYSLLAEITQLNEERNDDFRQMFGTYFEQQAAFYSNIGQQFAQLAQRFQKS